MVPAVGVRGLNSVATIPLDASSSSSMLFLDLVVMVIRSLGLKIGGNKCFFFSSFALLLGSSWCFAASSCAPLASLDFCGSLLGVGFAG